MVCNCSVQSSVVLFSEGKKYATSAKVTEPMNVLLHTQLGITIKKDDIYVTFMKRALQNKQFVLLFCKVWCKKVRGKHMNNLQESPNERMYHLRSKKDGEDGPMIGIEEKIWNLLSYCPPSGSR